MNPPDISDRGWMDMERNRLLDEADRRAAANRQAWTDHIARVNDSDKPEPNHMAAFVIILAASMVAGLAVWVAHALLTWLVRAAG